MLLPPFDKFYTRRNQQAEVLLVNDVAEIHRGRRGIRNRHNSFSSIIVPINRGSRAIRIQRNSPLLVVQFNRRRRAIRNRRTSFSPLVVQRPSEKQALKNTAYRKKARERQTDVQREAQQALNSAHRKRARKQLTTEQNAIERALDNARHKRAYREKTIEQRKIEQTLKSAQKKKAKERKIRISESTLTILSRAQLFRKSCGDLSWVNCPRCSTYFPDILLNSGICTSCFKEQQRNIVTPMFSSSHLMDPGVVPIELSRLTNIVFFAIDFEASL